MKVFVIFYLWISVKFNRGEWSLGPSMLCKPRTLKGARNPPTWLLIPIYSWGFLEFSNGQSSIFWNTLLLKYNNIFFFHLLGLLVLFCGTLENWKLTRVGVSVWYSIIGYANIWWWQTWLKIAGTQTNYIQTHVSALNIISNESMENAPEHYRACEQLIVFLKDTRWL